MECECSIDNVESDGYAAILSEHVPKARKWHSCKECGRKIRPGEKYERAVFVDAGIQTHKTCPDCMSIRKNFFCSWEYGRVLEEFVEYAHNCSGSIPEVCIARLTPRAMEWVCNVIEECW
ncbi:MAG: hypothetical protein PF495_13930 [Spirochaetales bacterium]|jgi:hypothetical protein|nr:hypothetical protein [Spirochaetales bacterium]